MEEDQRSKPPFTYKYIFYVTSMEVFLFLAYVTAFPFWGKSERERGKTQGKRKEGGESREKRGREKITLFYFLSFLTKERLGKKKCKDFFLLFFLDF